MKNFKKMIIIGSAIFFILICIYTIFNIINYREFKKIYSTLIDAPDGSIDLNEELCSIFENDKSFSYMVKNLEYTENEIKNPRIYFIDGMLSYLDDHKKLKLINGIDYNYPEIQNGEVNCYLLQKDFKKLFKKTYNINLKEEDLVENEEYMGAFYKANNKILFSKLSKLDDNENSLIKITSLSKSEDIYEMKVNCYSFRTAEEKELFKNTVENIEENTIRIKNKTVKFKLDRSNKYFNYSIISIK